MKLHLFTFGRHCSERKTVARALITFCRPPHSGNLNPANRPTISIPRVFWLKPGDPNITQSAISNPSFSKCSSTIAESKIFHVRLAGGVEVGAGVSFCREIRIFPCARSEIPYFPRRCGIMTPSQRRHCKTREIHSEAAHRIVSQLPIPKDV